MYLFKHKTDRIELRSVLYNCVFVYPCFYCHSCKNELTIYSRGRARGTPRQISWSELTIISLIISRYIAYNIFEFDCYLWGRAFKCFFYCIQFKWIQPVEVFISTSFIQMDFFFQILTTRYWGEIENEKSPTTNMLREALYTSKDFKTGNVDVCITETITYVCIIKIYQAR